MASVVYPVVPYAYIYEKAGGSHKQGKAYPEEALIVIQQAGNWYRIEDPGGDEPFDRPVDRSLYPEFWVKVADTVESHGNGEPPPPPA